MFGARSNCAFAFPSACLMPACRVHSMMKKTSRCFTGYIVYPKAKRGAEHVHAPIPSCCSWPDSNFHDVTHTRGRVRRPSFRLSASHRCSGLSPCSSWSHGASTTSSWPQWPCSMYEAGPCVYHSLTLCCPLAQFYIGAALVPSALPNPTADIAASI